MAASCPTRVAARTARRQELRGNGTKKPVERQKVVVVVVVVAVVVVAVVVVAAVRRVH